MLSISAGNRPGEVGSITVDRLGDSAWASHGQGRTETLQTWDLNNLTENCGCRWVLWPDESVRRLEWTHQMPEPDAVYSMDCAGSLVPGDRIRFKLGSSSGAMGMRPRSRRWSRRSKSPGHPGRAQFQSGSRPPGASANRRHPERRSRKSGQCCPRVGSTGCPGRMRGNAPTGKTSLPCKRGSRGEPFPKTSTEFRCRQVERFQFPKRLERRTLDRIDRIDITNT